MSARSKVTVLPFSTNANFCLCLCVCLSGNVVTRYLSKASLNRSNFSPVFTLDLIQLKFSYGNNFPENKHFCIFCTNRFRCEVSMAQITLLTEFTCFFQLSGLDGRRMVGHPGGILSFLSVSDFSCYFSSLFFAESGTANRQFVRLCYSSSYLVPGVFVSCGISGLLHTGQLQLLLLCGTLGRCGQKLESLEYHSTVRNSQWTTVDVDRNAHEHHCLPLHCGRLQLFPQVLRAGRRRGRGRTRRQMPQHADGKNFS